MSLHVQLLVSVSVGLADRRTRTLLKLPEHKPRRSSRPSPCSPTSAEHELREEQRIARQNDPERIRKQRLLRRLNPLKQTESFNALTIMSREGLPDGLGDVYTRKDLEYIRDKLVKLAPLEWRTQDWYRNGLREMGIDPDGNTPKSPSAQRPELHHVPSPALDTGNEFADAHRPLVSVTTVTETPPPEGTGQRHGQPSHRSPRLIS